CRYKLGTPSSGTMAYGQERVVIKPKVVADLAEVPFLEEAQFDDLPILVAEWLQGFLEEPVLSPRVGILAGRRVLGRRLGDAVGHSRIVRGMGRQGQGGAGVSCGGRSSTGVGWWFAGRSAVSGWYRRCLCRRRRRAANPSRAARPRASRPRNCGHDPRGARRSGPIPGESGRQAVPKRRCRLAWLVAPGSGFRQRSWRLLVQTQKPDGDGK